MSANPDICPTDRASIARDEATAALAYWQVPPRPVLSAAADLTPLQQMYAYFD